MTDKRRGLGRGLGALIPPAPSDTPTQRPSDVFFPDRSDGFTGNTQSEQDLHDGDELETVPGAVFAQLNIADIVANARQPRQAFDEDDLSELTQSIAEIGVLQPVVVRPAPTPQHGADSASGGVGDDAAPAATPQYELIMGERRLRASKAAGNTTIPAIIRSTADDDMLRDALLENLHRAQLNPLEEAAAYQQLLDDFSCTHEELAGRIGRSRPQISNTIRLLKLPPLVARRVAAGVLSAGHARALLALPDAAAMERLAQRIVAEGLSVRSTEEIVAVGEQVEKAARSRPTMGAYHPALEEIASTLSDRLDTRVGITLGKRKGRMTVEFASVQDLQRIIDALSSPVSAN